MALPFTSRCTRAAQPVHRHRPPRGEEGWTCPLTRRVRLDELSSRCSTVIPSRWAFSKTAQGHESPDALCALLFVAHHTASFPEHRGDTADPSAVKPGATSRRREAIPPRLGRWGGMAHSSVRGHLTEHAGHGMSSALLTDPVSRAQALLELEIRQSAGTPQWAQLRLRIGGAAYGG